MMKRSIAALCGLAVAAPSDAFSAPSAPSPPAGTSKALHVARTAIIDGDVATDFWGGPRDEREIVDFVSDAVFDGRRRQDNMRVEVISAEPPLLIVHGFLEHEHCDRIIDATIGPSGSAPNDGKHRLKRSTMGAEQEESDYRTSSTAWLREERCPTPLRAFASRAAALSGLPTANMENLQVVRYQPGEEFQLHTDHLDSFNEFNCGGRLCTCLVYLNDSEQSAGASSEATFTGGETNFPEFDAAITPRKGSALFFWNTIERPGSEGYNENMFLNVDTRLRHAGLPVLSGEKWVANRWIHPRNFGAGVRGLPRRDVFNSYLSTL